MMDYVRMVKTSRFETDDEGVREPGELEDVRFEIYDHETVCIEFEDGTGVYFDLEELLQIIGEYERFKTWDESQN